MTRRVCEKAMVVAVAAPLALASLASPFAAEAKRGCETTFFRGETIVTCTKGSHGSTDTHKGAPHSSGKDLGGGPCKATGSEQTNTC